MDKPDIDVVRALGPGLVLRADEGQDDPGMPTMVGHFARFNAWYEINSWYEGRFMERIAPGAFRDTFAAHWDDDDAHRIKVQFQHGYDSAVGMRLLGGLTELREDKVGGYYEVPLFDTSYNRDLVPGLEAGEYGASFRFRILAHTWVEEPGSSEHNPDGIPEDTITEARVFELGPVAFGASPTATSGLRSLTDQYYDAVRAVHPSIFEEACRAAGREIPTGRVDPRRTAGGGSGDEPTPASATPTPEQRSRALALRERRIR